VQKNAGLGDMEFHVVVIVQSRIQIDKKKQTFTIILDDDLSWIAIRTTHYCYLYILETERIE
jgi:hypothetical protein